MSGFQLLGTALSSVIFCDLQLEGVLHAVLSFQENKKVIISERVVTFSLPAFSVLLWCGWLCLYLFSARWLCVWVQRKADNQARIVLLGGFRKLLVDQNWFIVNFSFFEGGEGQPAPCDFWDQGLTPGPAVRPLSPHHRTSREFPVRNFSCFRWGVSRRFLWRARQWPVESFLCRTAALSCGRKAGTDSAKLTGTAAFQHSFV